MTDETLRELGDSILKPIRALQNAEQKSQDEINRAISNLPDIGGWLRRIEFKLDKIMEKLEIK